MKKTLSIVLFVLLVFLAVACNPEVKQHTHEWVKDTKKSYAATCEKIGKDIYTCSCGETKEEVIDKLGHAWDNGKETKASCETAGVKTYTCTREACGKTKTETIPATGHSWKQEPATTATCTTPGHVEKKCTSCGLVYVSQIDEFIDHDMRVDEELSKKSTCTTNGYLVLECSYNCGHKNIITLPLAEHTWDSGIEYNPTCTEDGYTIYTCGECHLVKKEVTKKAAGHTVPEFDKEGNVINWGEKEDLADYSKEEELMTTTGFAVDWQDENYKYEIETGNEATCVKPATYTGKCLVCGESVENFEGYHKDYSKHEYENTGDTHEIENSETILTPRQSGYHCTVEGCNPESENYWDDASLEPYKKADRTYIYSSIIGIWMTEEGDEYLIFTKDASGKDYELSVENGVIYGKRNKDVKDVDDGDGKKLDFYTETVSDYTWWLDAKDKKERMAISFESGVETDVRNNPTEIKIDYDSETGVPTRMTIGKTTYAFVSSDIKIDKESGTVVVTEELERYDAANHYYKKSYCDGFGAVIGNAHNFEGNVCEVCGKDPKNLVKVTIQYVDGNGSNQGIVFREYVEKGCAYELGSSFSVKGYLGDGYSSTYNGKTLAVTYWMDANGKEIKKSKVDVVADSTFKIFGESYN